MSGFMPHGHCFLWQPDVLWPYVLGNLLTAAAYFALPPMLAVLGHRRPDLYNRAGLYAFAAFIASCGIGHVIDTYTIWTPAYYLLAWQRVSTAAISVVTALLLLQSMPRLLRVPSQSQLTAADERARAAARRAVEAEDALEAARAEHLAARAALELAVGVIAAERGDKKQDP